MTFPPEPPVQIQNNFKEMFHLMPSTKLHKCFFSAEKRIGRAIDKRYLQIISPEPQFQNHNNFTEMVLKLPSAKTDQKAQLG